MYKRKRTILILLLAFVCLLVGCSSKSGEMSSNSQAASRELAETPAAPGGFYGKDDSGNYDYADDAVVQTEADEAEEEPVAGMGSQIGESGGQQAETRKIIYTVDLSLETTTFDVGVLTIPQLAEKYSGFVQNSYIEGTNMHSKYSSRSASFTLRIPADELDTFLGSLSDGFHVVYQQKNSSDITSNYYDTEARLSSLRIQEERLTAMLEESIELQYMLEVERELANVLYEIESITSSLKRMDSDVAMSTVTIYLQEVAVYDETGQTVAPITFGERVSETLGDSWDGFIAFWQNVLLFFIALLPFLPIIAAFLLLFILLHRRARKRKSAAIQGTASPIEPVQKSEESHTPSSPES